METVPGPRPSFGGAKEGWNAFGRAEGMIVEVVVEPTTGVSPGVATVATVPTVKGKTRVMKECFAALEQARFRRGSE